MLDRVEVARNDSDTALFLHLLYSGELILKLVTAGLLAAVAEDRERKADRIAQKLVRSDGVGDWVAALDEIVLGPAAHHIVHGAVPDRTSLTEKYGSGTWQFDAVSLLATAIEAIEATGAARQSSPPRVSLRQWFSGIAELRNRTRAHGATSPGTCRRAAPKFEESVRLIASNLPVLLRPWAYVYRDLSGRRICHSLGESPLRLPQNGQGQGDGVYIDFQEIRRVGLLYTDPDLTDFYLPNGGFNGTRFELLSLITDHRRVEPAAPYCTPLGRLPPSETEGGEALDVLGEAFSNLPRLAPDYVTRKGLEQQLYDEINNDHHPVITLVGRGGIGKTSLALTVLTRVADQGRFEVILWFSARDVDLLQEGAKLVTPQVVTKEDIAREFVQLLNPARRAEKDFDSLAYLASYLSNKQPDKPALFVFDNFETIRYPLEVFKWLDTQIRLPNKIVITTRSRGFKADYPIEVIGMDGEEAYVLMDKAAERLRIADLLTNRYKQGLFTETDGHPYAMKILLGDVAKARRLVPIERVIATKDEILDALFERVYAALSPAAQRVFLTLCSWRSLVPELAVEAVLLRQPNARMDVEAAIEELMQSSLIERIEGDDASEFLYVPVMALVFGKRKLETTPQKAAIDADLELIRLVGAAKQSAAKHGVRPPIERLFRGVGDQVESGKASIEDVRPPLEYICRQLPWAWLLLAQLYERRRGAAGMTEAAECVRRFIESAPYATETAAAWADLARIYEQQGNWVGAVQARVRICAFPTTEFRALSDTANWLNGLLRGRTVSIDSEEKRVVCRELAELMENRVREADPTDLSRLAWLCLHLGDEEAALRYAWQGLRMDPENDHCRRLYNRLRPAGR